MRTLRNCGYLPAVCLTVVGLLCATAWAADDTEIDAKIREIQKASKKITDYQELRLKVTELWDVADAAIQVDDYINANKAINIAVTFAAKSGNRQLIYRTKQKKDEILPLATEFKSISKFRKKLDNTPDDPSSNREIGLFLTAWKGEWQKGAEMLIKANDPLLKKIGEGESNPPEELAAQVLLAQNWREAGEAETGLLRQKMLKRAYHWYQTAWRKAMENAKVDIGNALGEMPFRYLTDMDELEVGEGAWTLGKYGETGGANRIVVDGIPYQLGLGMHPPEKGYFHVKYKLNGKYRTFATGCALNDNITENSGTLRFSILGDGRLIWKSGQFKQLNDAEFVTIDIKGVQILEVRTECSSWSAHSHAVWLDPCVMK